MLKLAFFTLLVASAFAQQEGLSPAQLRVQQQQQQILGTQQQRPTDFQQSSSGVGLPQSFGLQGAQQPLTIPQQALDSQQSFRGRQQTFGSGLQSSQQTPGVQLPANSIRQQSFTSQPSRNNAQQTFSNQQSFQSTSPQQTRLTFQELQQRRRLELEARQQQERLRQQRINRLREAARLQNQQRQRNQQLGNTNQQNTIRRPNNFQTQQVPVASRPQTAIRPVTNRPLTQTLDDDRDGPFQDGSYYFRFGTSDGIQREEGARLTGPNTLEVTGSYSYIAPDGTLVAMEYIADENGYRAYPVRPNQVNPVVRPEPILVPPPLRPVLNTPRPIINANLPILNTPRPFLNTPRPVGNRPRPSVARPNTNINRPPPPLITQPIPNFNNQGNTLQRPVQTFQRPVQNTQQSFLSTQRPVQNFQQSFQNTLRPAQNFQRPIQNIQRPGLGFQSSSQSVQRPIQTFQNSGQPLTPRPFIQSQNINSRPTVQPIQGFSFNNNLRRNDLLLDYDYSNFGDFDYDGVATNIVGLVEPPPQTFLTPDIDEDDKTASYGG